MGKKETTPTEITPGCRVAVSDQTCAAGERRGTVLDIIPDMYSGEPLLVVELKGLRGHRTYRKESCRLLR